jgi:hypothetical protein
VYINITAGVIDAILTNKGYSVPVNQSYTTAADVEHALTGLE